MPAWPALGAGLLSAAGVIAATRVIRPPVRRSLGEGGKPDATAEVTTFLLIVGGLFAWLVWLARPDFLPLGHGTDLTHHLLLIDYIERHWQLVHDRAVGVLMGEMTVYTPGSHILMAMAGRWTGTSGTHVLHTVMSAATALKVGFVYLIALRLLPDRGPRVPLAAFAAIAHLASPTFFLGSFTTYSFVAQVIAEFFAVAMWWFVTAWYQQQEDALLLFLAGIAGAAAFLTWPTVMGPPAVLLALLILIDGPRGLLARIARGGITLAPIAVIAYLFTSDRLDMARIVGAAGLTTPLSVGVYGWPFLMLSSAGLLLAVFDRRARPLALVALALALQIAGLWAYARWNNNVPYMAMKMFYLALSMQAVGAAVAVGLLWHWAGMTSSRAAWALTAAAFVVVAAPFERNPALAGGQRPAVVADIEQAGLWARANLPVSCIEYLVDNDDTAYWLHMAVLGNPRQSARTGDNTTFELTPSLVRWLMPGGRTYAIADLPALPNGIRDDLDIIQKFGRAAVAKRRGPSACPDSR